MQSRPPDLIIEYHFERGPEGTLQCSASEKRQNFAIICWAATELEALRIATENIYWQLKDKLRAKLNKESYETQETKEA